MNDNFLPRLAVCLVALSGPSAALTLDFPGPASETAARVEALTSYRMPVGPFNGDVVESRLTEGRLDQRTFRLDAPGLSTLQLLKPLRDQVIGAGFKVIYECEAVACGGFDFRYGTEVMPEPEMHVDLGDFRYLAAERSTSAGPEHISLLVSRAVDQGFVQVTRISPTALPATGLVAPSEQDRQSLPRAQTGTAAPVQTVPAAPAIALGERLIAGGAQVLPDLVFASGSAALSEGAFASLTELAAFLKENPQARVMLVGHTDASGGLAANIALSRQRAQSVRQRLLTAFDIPPRQIDAEGVGFLSPRAPNDTEAGRLANRRVEVMLLTIGTD